MGAPGYTNDDVVMHGGLSGARFKGSTSALRSAATTTIAALIFMLAMRRFTQQ